MTEYTIESALRCMWRTGVACTVQPHSSVLHIQRNMIKLTTMAMTTTTITTQRLEFHKEVERMKKRCKRIHVHQWNHIHTLFDFILLEHLFDWANTKSFLRLSFDLEFTTFVRSKLIECCSQLTHGINLVQTVKRRLK